MPVSCPFQRVLSDSLPLLYIFGFHLSGIERLNKTISPDGTITKVDFGYKGNAVKTWIGTTSIAKPPISGHCNRRQIGYDLVRGSFYGNFGKSRVNCMGYRKKCCISR